MPLTAIRPSDNIRFAARIKPEEMPALRELIKAIPELGDEFAAKLKPEDVSVFRNQKFGGLKGVFTRLNAAPAGLSDLLKLELLGKRPFVQWVQFQSPADAARFHFRRETTPEHGNTLVKETNLIKWWKA